MVLDTNGEILLKHMLKNLLVINNLKTDIHNIQFSLPWIKNNTGIDKSSLLVSHLKEL